MTFRKYRHFKRRQMAYGVNPGRGYGLMQIESSSPLGLSTPILTRFL